MKNLSYWTSLISTPLLVSLVLTAQAQIEPPDCVGDQVGYNVYTEHTCLDHVIVGGECGLF